MELALLVYAISLLPKVSGFILTVTIGCGAACLAFLLYRVAELPINSWDSESYRNEKKEKQPFAEKWMKRFGITALVLSLIGVAIPSERTAYMMVGAYTAQTVAQNQKVQETGKKVIDLINQKLDSYIDEGAEQVEKAAEKTVKKAKKAAE